jgi:hypothetical protein
VRNSGVRRVELSLTPRLCARGSSVTRWPAAAGAASLDAAQRTVARQVIKAVAAATDDGTAQLPAELVDSLEHYRSLSGEAPIIVALDPSGEDRKSRIELWTYSPSDALLVRGTPES